MTLGEILGLCIDEFVDTSRMVRLRRQTTKNVSITQKLVKSS